MLVYVTFELVGQCEEDVGRKVAGRELSLIKKGEVSVQLTSSSWLGLGCFEIEKILSFS